MDTSEELSELAVKFTQATRQFQHKRIRPHVVIPGLTEAESRALIDLHFISKHLKAGVTAGMLGKHLNLSPSATSQLIRSLEEKQLVTRTMSKSDSRKVVVTLSEEGERLADLAHADLYRLLNVFIERVGEKNIEELLEIIDKIQSVLSEMEQEGLLENNSVVSGVHAASCHHHHN